VLADEAFQRLVTRRVAFEKERGVTSVRSGGEYAYLLVTLTEGRPRAEQELEIYRRIAARSFSMNLLKLHRQSISFVVDQPCGEAVAAELEAAGYRCQVTPSVAMLSVYAAAMRHLSGVMGRITAALGRHRIPVVQTGDAPDHLFCLVERGHADAAVEAIRSELHLPPPLRRIVVQKFGGRSVGTDRARRLAAERVVQARQAGAYPVVVVSAIGRKGEPYATDTLLDQLERVEPGVDDSPRDRDLLMACGEIISTVIMAQTLKAMGLKSIALTGGQAGILTDFKYGDAQIVDIDPSYILKLIYEQEYDAVVVAGFQGITEPESGGVHGAITTLGRGGSDTTASALGVALKAERVEIYTHVDGVMTADPERVPEAKTLPLVTYEEVAEMAHQGAKVLHPRAAEIAMIHQIPLWVKSSFVDSPGTRVAALAEVQPPSRRGVSGVATLTDLTYFTLRPVEPEQRAGVAERVFLGLGELQVPMTLTSLGPRSISFIVNGAQADEAARMLRADPGLPFERVDACEMVSVVALGMWDIPGFLYDIARALYERDVAVLQMADSEGSVSVLVRKADATAALRALHEAFELGA
jgi:aspartate kinase